MERLGEVRCCDNASLRVGCPEPDRRELDGREGLLGRASDRIRPSCVRCRIALLLFATPVKRSTQREQAGGPDKHNQGKQGRTQARAKAPHCVSIDPSPQLLMDQLLWRRDRQLRWVRIRNLASGFPHEDEILVARSPSPDPLFFAAIDHPSAALIAFGSHRSRRLDPPHTVLLGVGGNRLNVHPLDVTHRGDSTGAGGGPGPRNRQPWP